MITRPRPTPLRTPRPDNGLQSRRLLEVCGLNDLTEGIPTVVSAGRVDLAMIRWRDRVFALRNSCPHESHSFEHGAVRPDIKGGHEIEEVVQDEVNAVLYCPFHHWGFRLADGGCTAAGSRLRVKSYPTSVEDGRVMVEVGRVADPG
jgi:nitrite reductase/ring-hydroxylating ferredoxin subunit